MKRLRQLFLMCLLTMAGTGAFAYNFEANGLYYNILDATAKTVEVTYPNDREPGYLGTGTPSGYNDTDMTEVTIPATVSDGSTTYTVTTIGDHAFYYCTKLTSVTFHENITEIGDYAFYGCESFTKLTIPSHVKSVGNLAIANCKELEDLTIEEGVTEIGKQALWGCTRLTDVTIPASVTSIGEDVFSNCSALQSVTIKGAIETLAAGTFRYCRKLTSVTLPESLKSVGNSAFHTCASLTEITIPDGVESIGSYAFEYCTALSSWPFGSNSSITEIGACTFEGCTSLTEVTIPDRVKSIGTRAFYGCSSLTALAIGSSVESIVSSAAFWNCNLVTISVAEDNDTYTSRNSSGEECNVIVSKEDGTLIFGCKTTVIPDNVKTIGEYAFFNSTITSAAIPDGVTSIGQSAFSYCENLTELTFGSGVKSIGYGALESCRGLKTVISRIEAPAQVTFEKGEEDFMGGGLFGESYSHMKDEYSKMTLYVPAGTVEAYQDSEWAEYFKTITDKVSIELKESNGTGYATYCTTADLDFTGVEGVKAYVASEYADGSVTLKPVTKVPAGTGILLIGEGGTHEVPFVLTDETIEDNLLKGTLTATALPQTTTIDDADYTNYVLGSKNDEVGFYKSSGTGNIAAHKAYLQLPAKAGVSGVRILIADDHATGIEATARQESATQDGAVYNLRGQRVENPQRGLYIVNGKKVVLK